MGRVTTMMMEKHCPSSSVTRAEIFVRTVIVSCTFKVRHHARHHEVDGARRNVKNTNLTPAPRSTRADTRVEVLSMKTLVCAVFKDVTSLPS